MRQAELITRIAESTGESKASISRVLRALAEVATDCVVQGDELRLSQIGTVSSRRRAPTVVRGIHNGRRMLLGERFVPSFKPAVALRRAAARRAPQHWRDPAHQDAWRLAESLIGDLELYHSARPEIAEQSETKAIVAACHAAFGEDWVRVVQTYESAVASIVRETSSYLIDAVRERWT